MTDTLLTDFTLSLAQSGIERDTLLYDLTDAEAVALLTPLLDKARAAGAAEMQERCAGVAAGPYRNVSQYHEDSPYFGSDLTPDRSEFGRGKQAGRTAAATAIRSLT